MLVNQQLMNYAENKKHVPVKLIPVLPAKG